MLTRGGPWRRCASAILSPSAALAHSFLTVPARRDIPQAEACMVVLQEAGVSCEYVEEPLCAADVRELPALYQR